MAALNDELADTSNDIARTMAEAAAAPLLVDPLPPPFLALTDNVTAASATEGTNSTGSGGDGVGGVGPGATVGPAVAGATAACGSVGRSREEAQAEVDRLKARQVELCELIRCQREVGKSGCSFYIESKIHLKQKDRA